MEELPHSDHLRGYLEILSLASQVRLSLQYRRMPRSPCFAGRIYEFNLLKNRASALFLTMSGKRTLVPEDR